MSRVLNDQSVLMCMHMTGRVGLPESQDFVWMATESGPARMLVDPTLTNTSINGCSNQPIEGKQCKKADGGPSKGRSTLLFVSGRPVILDTVVGATFSVPPSVYKSTDPRQDYIHSTD